MSNNQKGFPDSRDITTPVLSFFRRDAEKKAASADPAFERLRQETSAILASLLGRGNRALTPLEVLRTTDLHMVVSDLDRVEVARLVLEKKLPPSQWMRLMNSFSQKYLFQETFLDVQGATFFDRESVDFDEFVRCSLPRAMQLPEYSAKIIEYFRSFQLSQEID